MPNLYPYIAFEGAMGSDKRELARLVAKALDAELIEDVTENPFLEDFYKGKANAAFQSQLFYLLNRYQLLRDVRQRNLFQQTKVSNFILDKDRIYAFQNLTDSELSLYEQLYKLLTLDHMKPDLVVYLQLSTEKVLENLRKKKGMRHSVSAEYVDDVVEAYNRFFFHYKETPLIILNGNQVNFDRDREALKDLLSYFSKELRGVTYLTPQSQL